MFCVIRVMCPALKLKPSPLSDIFVLELHSCHIVTVRSFLFNFMFRFMCFAPSVKSPAALDNFWIESLHKATNKCGKVHNLVATECCLQTSMSVLVQTLYGQKKPSSS